MIGILKVFLIAWKSRLNMEMLKAKIKRNPLLGKMVSGLRARQLKSQYHQTVSYYAGKDAYEGAKANLASVKLRLKDLFTTDKTPNLFYLGTDELQDRGGILQALEKFGNLAYYTGPNGSYGHNLRLPRAIRQQKVASRLWDLVVEANGQGRPIDILITQTWANYVDSSIFSRIRKEYGTIIINISMDDRHQYWGEKSKGEWGGAFGLIPNIDLTLTAAPECVDWYLKEGCPALFFPEASDSSIYYSMPSLPKIYDVSFVGACYGIRQQIVLEMEKAGIKVKTFGTGWGTGRLATEEIPTLFAQSKIILGIGTVGHCKDFFSLKMRDFDGPMSGSLYLTHDNRDLYSLFEIEKEIVTYRNVKECVEKALYFLENDVEREAIAKAGRLRAERDHTWEKRFETIFSLLTPNALK